MITTLVSAATSLYSFKVKDAKNNDVSLSDYNGKVVLIVNVASRCGYTNQYEGLQNLYTELSDKGFVILGFPSNQFLGQEPGSNEEIQKFCKLNYGVTFPIFAKIDVNGTDAIPLYKWLTADKKSAGRVTWNFNKFLIDRKGNVVDRFDSKDKPVEIAPKIKKIIETKI
jgi:glutathione peroxidase